MALGKLTFREIRRRPGRAILTLFSVVIGVAMVVSVSVATNTTRRAFNDMFTAINGRASLEVMSAAGAPFDQSVLAKIQSAGDVEAAVPLLRQSAIMYFGDHQRVTVNALGIDQKLDRAVRDNKLVDGKLADPSEDELLIDDGLAKKLGVKVGDEVRLLARSGRTTFTIAGLIAPNGPSLGGQGAIYLPLSTAQRRLRSAGKIDAVQVVARDGADLTVLHEQIKKALPPGLVVLRPAAGKSQADELLLSTEQGLWLATCFSWFLSGLLVLNTFQMNVAERRRQLAILRAIGATRKQVVRLVCREAFWMGLAGTVLGLLFGLLGARLLNGATGQLLQMSLPPLQISWQAIALALVVGPVISLLGAFLPAWRAGQLSPLEGMGAVLSSDMESLPSIVTQVGLGILLMGCVMLAACTAGLTPAKFAIVAGIALLFGLVCLIPVSLTRLSQAAAFMLRWLGIEARLAERQILRRRGRTTLTVAVLFLALAFGIGLGNTIVDSVLDVQKWSANAAQGDFFVRAMMPDMSTGLASDLPEGLRAELRAIPGVTGMQGVRFAKCDVLDQGVIIVAGDFGADDNGQFRFELLQGDRSQVNEAFRRGEVLVGTVFALRARLNVGDQIPLHTDKGITKVRIAGTVNDYLAGGLTLYMERGSAQRLLGIGGTDALAIWAERDKLDAVENALQAACDKHGLLLQTHRAILGIIDSMMNGLVGSLWFLLVIVFIVVGFGVVNTLTMNVLEQTREVGLLRTIAMTRRQVRKMVLAQAAILALIGLGPGLVAGLAVAWLMNVSTQSLVGHPIEFVVHTHLVGAAFFVAFAIVLIAAWFPAARAARLKLAEALQYQ